MARAKPSAKADFVLFDIVYDDGSRSSNRKVPGDMVDTLDGDAPVRAFFESMEREIAERSGRPRPAIKEIVRVKKR
jgi:hypothetical protein